MLKQLKTGLAWLWVLCAGLAVLEFLGVIQLTSHPATLAVRWGMWGLAWPAGRQFARLQPVPYALWAGLLGVAGLWVLSFFIGIFGLFTQLPGQYAYSFFLGDGDESGPPWHTSYVYYRRGRALLVSQTYSPLTGGQADTRAARLTPLTPLLYWVSPLPPGQWTPAEKADLARQGWVKVDRFTTYFSLDPAEQRRLDAQKVRQDAEELRQRRAYEATPEGAAMSAAVRRDSAANADLRSAEGVE